MELVCPEYDKRQYVLKLNHAINGTKQSGKKFNVKLDKIMQTELKMNRLSGGPCVYTRGSEQQGNQMVVACHVDDYQYVG